MGLKESGLRGSLRSVSTGVGVTPDSVTSRPEDNNTTTGDFQAGFEISLTSDWPSIAARISQNTSGQTTAYLREDDDTLIDSQDISALSAGDTFSFDGVNLSSGQNYFITIDAGGSDYTLGINNDVEYPFEGDDLDIVARYFDGDTDTTNVINLNDIGNPDGVLS